jgi:hypothetical protein
MKTGETQATSTKRLENVYGADVAAKYVVCQEKNRFSCVEKSSGEP